MKDTLIKLLKVKSLVTMCVTGVFSVLAIRGDITPELFMTVFTTIIAFYFGTNIQKHNDSK